MVIEYWIDNVSCYEENEGNNQDGWITVSVNGGTHLLLGQMELKILMMMKYIIHLTGRT